MAAQLIITTNTAAPIQAGATLGFAATTSGLMASLNGSAITWANLTGCQVLSGNLLRDNSGGADGWNVSGANSAANVASGEVYAEFVAAAPASFPGYPEFGGRAFFAGLTSATTAAFADIDFGIQLSEGILDIYESGVWRRSLGNPRIDGVYRVGVENGQVIYRADNAIIYRSDQPIAYPLRFGARFFHRGVDQIGGTPSGSITWKLYDVTGAEVVGAFSGATLTAPATKGRYKVTAGTADYLYGSAWISVQKRYPDEFTGHGLFPATKFQPAQPMWNVKKNEYDDQGITTSVPFPTVAPKQIFDINYTNWPKTKTDILDAFANDHRNDADAFFFWDKRAGVMLDNCRIVEYRRTHNRLNRIQSRVVKIEHRPR
jgi:hypothetical protein